MAEWCPLKDGPALYLECSECDDKMCKAFFCLVAGSRTFDDYDLMAFKLDRFLSKKEKVVIVSGGARGADSLAERYAADRGYATKIFPADWNMYGKQAGMRRNRQMCEYIRHARDRGVVVFWDGHSKGTANTMKLSAQYGLALRTVLFSIKDMEG